MTSTPEVHSRYNRSEKGKARQKRYLHSEKGLAAMRRYNNSEKGRANVKRWRADPDNRLSESNRNTRRVRRNRIREREAMIRGEVE